MITREQLQNIEESSKYYIKIDEDYFKVHGTGKTLRNQTLQHFFIFYYEYDQNYQGHVISKVTNDRVSEVVTLEFMKENYPELLI
jgi:hypothetical protein